MIFVKVGLQKMVSNKKSLPGNYIPEGFGGWYGVLYFSKIIFFVCKKSPAFIR